MIKRVLFATARDTLTGDTFASALASALAAPDQARPVRVVACITLPDLTGPEPKHDGVGIWWFTDAEHLQRFEAWLDSAAGRDAVRRLDESVDPARSPVVVVEESVMRGADWLEQRWCDGGDKLKHMAVALRAGGLSPAEFSERWRSRAGQVRRAGASQATVIPDTARGLAYVQNHPVPRASGEWAYDALNEVYFDDVDSLRTRIEWFRENLGDQTEEDLVRESWFLAAREQIVNR